MNLANLLFVEASRLVLSIPRDERNRIPFIEQLQRAGYLVHWQAKIARDMPQVDRGGCRHAIIEPADMDSCRARRRVEATGESNPMPHIVKSLRRLQVLTQASHCLGVPHDATTQHARSLNSCRLLKTTATVSHQFAAAGIESRRDPGPAPQAPVSARKPQTSLRSLQHMALVRASARPSERRTTCRRASPESTTQLAPQPAVDGPLATS